MRQFRAFGNNLINKTRPVDNLADWRDRFPENIVYGRIRTGRMPVPQEFDY
ncbi:MAG: hypothetical protein F6K47_41475 [Symploca sp. SIO2E6]|nr:hypothetical protein [Symploca sp. SIO2E6]